MAFFDRCVYFRALHSGVMRVFLCATMALFCTGFWIALFFVAETALAAATQARIIYTADTLGYLHPCSTCGDTAQGGMARRATLIATLTSGQARPLVLAGSNEFYDDRSTGNGTDAKRIMPVFHSALSQIPYTAVYVSPKASAQMKKSGLSQNTSWTTVTSEPVTNYFQVGNLTAACVFFPPGSVNEAPTPAQLLAVQHAGKEARTKANLIIGVSPWGMFTENSLMPSLAGYFHVVFGGGSGIAIPGQATGTPDMPGPLWARADRKGRALNVLDIFSMPSAPFGPWLDGIHFTSSLVFLEKSLPEDNAVRKSLAPIPLDAE